MFYPYCPVKDRNFTFLFILLSLFILVLNRVFVCVCVRCLVVLILVLIYTAYLINYSLLNLKNRELKRSSCGLRAPVRSSFVDAAQLDENHEFQLSNVQQPPDAPWEGRAYKLDLLEHPLPEACVS